MARAPLRPCAHGGCPRLVERGRCNEHARVQQRAADERRGSARERGYDYAWGQASKAFIREHPLCYYCELRGRLTEARCVDHATPPSGPHDPLFWDRSNWRPACIQCNSSKGDDDEKSYLARIGIVAPPAAGG